MSVEKKLLEVERHLQQHRSTEQETVRVREIAKVVYMEMLEKTKKVDLLMDIAPGGISDRIKDPTERQTPEYLKLEEQFHTRCLDKIDNPHQSSETQAFQPRRGRSASMQLTQHQEQLRKLESDLLRSQPQGLGRSGPMEKLADPRSSLPIDKTRQFPEDGSQESGQGASKRRKVEKAAFQELQLDQIKKTFGQALWDIDTKKGNKYQSHLKRWKPFEDAMEPLLWHFRLDMSRQELSDEEFQICYT